MRIDAISIGENPPFDVNVIIEVPIGGEPIKYEMDKAAGALVVDRFLYTSMRYPGNYGFVPHTLSGDGDPCDVIVANDVTPDLGVMGGDDNTVHLVTAEGVETWPTLPKDEVARRLDDPHAIATRGAALSLFDSAIVPAPSFDHSAKPCDKPRSLVK